MQRGLFECRDVSARAQGHPTGAKALAPIDWLIGPTEVGPFQNRVLQSGNVLALNARGSALGESADLVEGGHGGVAGEGGEERAVGPA